MKSQHGQNHVVKFILLAFLSA